MDFIFVGLLEDWNLKVGSTAKNIALELSLHHRVLYVNKSLDRKTIAQEKDNPFIQQHAALLKNKQNSLFEVQKNLWSFYPPSILESLNWIPWDFLFLALSRINSKRLAKDVQDAAQQLSFKDYIVFNDNEIFKTFYLKELLQPKLYIYFSRDNLLGVPYWKKHGAKIEPMHIAKSDLAMANSVYLSNYCRQFNPESYYIGQGCDLAHFNYSADYEKPDEVKALKGPIIGYVGAIVSLRIDHEAIEAIGRHASEWNIVLVGPEDDFFAKSPLHSYKNVHFLGKKPLSDLPAYISSFDVCINPQLLNEVTIGNYPLKVDEYLAMGKPTVVTRTEATQIFEDCVYVADQPADYPRLIETALREDSLALQEKRVNMAKSHTWTNTVECMFTAIDKATAH